MPAAITVILLTAVHSAPAVEAFLSHRPPPGGTHDEMNNFVGDKVPSECVFVKMGMTMSRIPALQTHGKGWTFSKPGSEE